MLQPLPACQSIYDKEGVKIFNGEWDPKVMFDVLTAGDPSFWSQKRVLEIGGNTGGLAIEIARRGAEVLLAEPDPYENNFSRGSDAFYRTISKENLAVEYRRIDLFESLSLNAEFDVIVCLGLIYHFKYPQLIIDHLSQMAPDYLFISTQTHPGTELAMYNRQHPGILPERLLDPNGALTGWHPTRPLFEAMLRAGGFDEVASLTESLNFPNKLPGLTNSAYYRAKCTGSKSPE